jgi:hypothetical protein
MARAVGGLPRGETTDRRDPDECLSTATLLLDSEVRDTSYEKRPRETGVKKLSY